MLRYFMRNVEAQSLHQRLLDQRVAHRRAEHQLAVLLAELADRRLFAELGYASVQDYAEIVLDLPKRTTRDLVRIGRKLPDFPVLAAAMSAGELDWTKARGGLHRHRRHRGGLGRAGANRDLPRARA